MKNETPLRVVLERTPGRGMSLVSVERADGLIEPEPEDRLTQVDWFTLDWQGAGASILSGLLDEESLERYQKVVVLGCMWHELTQTPIGDFDDSGFRVDEIVQAEKREGAAEAAPS